MDMLSRELGGVFIMGEHLFEKLARDRGITVEEMREIISARIRRGMNDPDPKKRAQWETIPHEGELPTPEEWLYYAVNYLIELGIEICCGGIRICEWAALEGVHFWGYGLGIWK